MNESAFPTMDAGELDKCPSLVSPGMSLRDYFAATAANGILAADVLDENGETCIVFNSEGGPTFNHPAAAPRIAAMAYSLADAMMTERAKI